MTFVMMAPLPVPHELTPALTLPPAPEIAKAEPVPALTVGGPKPEVLPPAPARSDAAPAPPEPVRPAPPVVAPPPAPVKPPPPPVTVGLFADPVPTVHQAAPVKAIQNAGFDAPSPAGTTGDAKTAASVGAFDPATRGQPAKAARPGVVVAAGFGANKSEAALNPRQIAEVRASGFETPRPVPAAQRMTPPPADRVEIAVEILFKPSPVYSD